ncbi:MAG: hypothetical protein JXC32_14470, partial [Anaerolineae bacterium]|nr:hypothetical protein [Anaerolineae bacterium]
YLTAVTSEVERPLAFALVISLRPLGGFFGSMLGGFLPGLFVRANGETSLSSVTQPRAYGLTLALGAVIYAPVIWSLWTLPRDGPSEQPQGVSPQADTVPEAPALSQPAWARLAALSRGAPLGILVSIAVVCFLRVGGEFTARTFFSVYADARWAIPTAQIGGIIALSSLLTIPAPLVTPALVARYGRVKMITAGAAGTAASIALLGVGANWGLASLAFVGISVLGAAARSVWSLVIQESVDEVWRPASAAVANLFSGLGTMAMSSAGGVLAAGVGYRATFLSSAALVAAGAVTVWFAFRQVVD